MHKGKYLWGAVFLIALLVVIGVLLKSDKSIAPGDGFGPTSSPTSGTMPLDSSPSKSSPSSRKQATPAPTIDYDSALKMYEGKRIQFDAYCQASPNAIIVKSGSGVMFDNRSGDARWFSLDGVGYYVAGYGFRVISMEPKSVPHTYIVGCGSATSVGKITVVE